MSTNEMSLDIDVHLFPGTFQTKMLLHEFPLDYQELPVTLYSRLPRDQVVLKQDNFEYSYINRDNMNDPQVTVL